MKKVCFNEISMTPTATVAGDSYVFSIKMVTGKDYTHGMSRLVFDFPGTLGMSRPSLLHQEEPGFVEAFVNNPELKYETKIWDMEISDFASKEKTSWRGMGARTAVLDLWEGVKEGDVIELKWGSPGRGYGVGVKVSTVVPELDYENTVHVRYFESHDEGIPDFGRDFDGYKRPVPVCEKALPFKIMPRQANALHLLRKPDKAMLIPRDIFWNAADVDDPALLVDAPCPCARNGSGVFEYADKNVQIKSKELPLFDAPAMDDVFEDRNIYWGDIHTHSCYSIDCLQREKMPQTPANLMDFAKNNSGLDFYAVTDHHEPWRGDRHRIGLHGWNDLLEAVKQKSVDGEFLAFPGIEYRCKRGDTAIVFNCLPEYEKINAPAWTDVRKVWEALKGMDYLSIAHFHNPGTLPEGEWWENIESGAEPALEIFSCHGSYEREDAMEMKPPLIKSRRFDRYGNYFLQKGYRYGFCANSDGHKGIVGTNGITAVYSKSLDKKSIFEAYRKRNIYATSNARIRLLFTGNGQLMGAVVPNQTEKNLFIDIVGESELKKIDLFRNGELYKRFLPDGKSFVKELTIKEDEASNWYVRATQKDNHMAYSSPIWFE